MRYFTWFFGAEFNNRIKRGRALTEYVIEAPYQEMKSQRVIFIGRTAKLGDWPWMFAEPWNTWPLASDETAWRVRVKRAWRSGPRGKHQACLWSNLFWWSFLCTLFCVLLIYFILVYSRSGDGNPGAIIRFDLLTMLLKDVRDFRCFPRYDDPPSNCCTNRTERDRLGHRMWSLANLRR